jgi:N-acetylglucosamine-6-sulfatase
MGSTAALFDTATGAFSVVPTVTDDHSATGTASKAISVIDSRPNIVVIMTDDQDDMGSMSVMPKTRSLIGNQGLTFTNSFNDFPLCCPSRASFLTGQAAHNTGVLSNSSAENGGYAAFQPTEGNSLPVWLQQAGYRTVHMGKYLNGFGPSNPIPPGWTNWQGIADGQGAYYYYNYAINRNGVLQFYGESASEYKTDVQAQDAENFIASQQGSAQPFFLWLNPLAPHMSMDPANPTSLIQLPPVPAPRHLGVYDNLPLPNRPNFNEADVSDKPEFVKLFPFLDSAGITNVTTHFHRRRESLLSVDDLVERVVNALQAAGKLSNTYIIFTSDNGDFEGQHRRPGYKMLVYEESIRVPLLIRGPGIPAGETRSQLVNNLDLVATMEELTGITPGRAPDGRSLVPLFQNASSPWRTSLLVQGVDKVQGLAPLYGRYQAIRTNRFVYAEHNGAYFGFEREFYDLAADPYQLTSKPADPAYASIVSDLQSRLNTLRTCAGANCWMTTPEPPPPCIANATTLCLNNSRFSVGTQWLTPGGGSGAGQVILLTGDTGAFWFFSSNNVEMVIKVLNGCGVNSRYWTFAGGLTNVNVILTVTDTQTGAVKTYTNLQGTPFQPIQDTGGFTTCP